MVPSRFLALKSAPLWVVLQRISIAIFTIWVLVGSALMGYWSSDSSLPSVTVQIEPVNVNAIQGRFLSVKWVLDRNRYCETTRSDFIIDSAGTRWVIPQLQFIVQPGPLGRDTFVTLTPIPIWAALGPARLNVQLQYVCNPIQRFITNGIIDWNSVQFNIVDSQ